MLFLQHISDRECIFVEILWATRMADLKREFDYYVAHQSELVKKYAGRFIVIIGEEVVGDYDSIVEAVVDCDKRFKPGTFMIQECLPGEENYTQTFHSRVAFA